MKKNKNPSEELDNIFSSKSKQPLNKEDFDFEERVINSDVIQLITRLMKSDGRNWNQEKLAKELDVSPAYISKLFSGDKKVNINLIARLERVFNARIRIVTSDMLVKNNQFDTVWKQPMQFHNKRTQPPSANVPHV